MTSILRQLNISGHRAGLVVDPAYSLPEPQPDWSQAVDQWQAAWPAHTFGFATIFVIIDVYIIVVLTSLHRRAAAQPHTAVVGVFVGVACACRSAYLFINPYESRGVSHVLISRLLYVVVQPALMTSFNLQQSAVVRLTKSSQSSSVTKRRLLAASVFVSLYFVSVVTIETLIPVNNRWRLMRILTLSVFIVWTLVSCFSFVYNGFTVVQFTKEAGKVLLQFAEYSRVKNKSATATAWEEDGGGKRREMALHHIRRSKLLSRRAIDAEASPDDAASSSSMSLSAGSSTDSDTCVADANRSSASRNAATKTNATSMWPKTKAKLSNNRKTRGKTKQNKKTRQRQQVHREPGDSISESADGWSSDDNDLRVRFWPAGNGNMSHVVTDDTDERRTSYHNASFLPSSYTLSDVLVLPPVHHVATVQKHCRKPKILISRCKNSENADSGKKSYNQNLNYTRPTRNVNNNDDCASDVSSSESLTLDDGELNQVKRVRESDDGGVKDAGYAADIEPCVSQDSLHLHPGVSYLPSSVTDSPLHQPFTLRPTSGYTALFRIKRAPQMHLVSKINNLFYFFSSAVK